MAPNSKIVFLIILGVASSLSLPPYGYLIVNFFTFSTFFIFLFKKSKITQSKKHFFIYGWLFGFGYFLSSLYWISISLTFDQNFKFLKQNLKYNNVLNVDGVFADLGVSSHQFDSAVRGFSIRYDSEIDMRMNTNSSFDAQEILNEYSESQLSNILFDYADLRNSKEISKTIV